MLMDYYEHPKVTYAILIIQHTSRNSLSMDGWTNQRTDMGNYRAAIAAKHPKDFLKNVKNVIGHFPSKGWQMESVG